MSDVLGLCPVCGEPPVHLTDEVVQVPTPRGLIAVGAAPRMYGDTFVVCHGCRLAVTHYHWSLLRRKMTREEANTLLAPFHGSPDMGATDEQPTTAQWSALKSAITGEKP